MPRKICVILVLYNPNKGRLIDLVFSLKNQVDKFFIYDNTINLNNKNHFDFLEEIDFEYYGDMQNIGIAQAQNTLLLKAKQQGFEFALLSDQDTIYPIAYINNLISCITNMDNFAAICPNWSSENSILKNEENGQFVFNKHGKLQLEKYSENIIYISHAISSGMIIKLSVLDSVGLMREDLFIDWVDNDWCWRAGKESYKIIFVPWVKIEHVLGENQVKVLGRSFVKRNSIRNYYIVRNAIFLFLHEDFNINIRFYLFKKVIHHIIFSVISTKEYFTEICFLSKAVNDGVFRKMGKSNFKKIEY
jgi:rhamnosyltransferase